MTYTELLYYRAPLWAKGVKFIFCVPQLRNELATASFERLSWLFKQRRTNIFIARCGFVTKDWRRVFQMYAAWHLWSWEKNSFSICGHLQKVFVHIFFSFMCKNAFLYSNQWNWPRTIRPCVLFPFLPWLLTPFPCAGIFKLWFLCQTNIRAATLAVSRNCKTLLFCEQCVCGWNATYSWIDDEHEDRGERGQKRHRMRVKRADLKY